MILLILYNCWLSGFVMYKDVKINFKNIYEENSLIFVVHFVYMLNSCY